ncbi:hypothetical protein N0V90_012049 [Kalmusia sp. IMI 367209]|nr:hypothetical protein N0V90_012049 [Kalmusia sp. IMI 367209]
MPTEIPKPPGWPIIGNVLDLAEPDSTAKLLAKYGSIVKVNLGTGKPDRISIGSVELLNEVCDEKRFVKMATAGGLVQVRNLTGDGLFTARDGEENWGLAHRILAPVLGPMMIGTMFEGIPKPKYRSLSIGSKKNADMHEVACQLIMKWARLEQNARIPVTDDFTRLTLDTLALCAMDTRFNSFYSETPHPFVDSMNTFLEECGMRVLRPSLVTDYVYRNQTRKFNDDIDVMRHVANTVVERRKSASSRKRDLVDAMLYEKDPVSGKALPHENVINNMITFLIAGHETTSGLLSFIIYCLAKHPSAMEKAREEVLSVLGHGAMTLDMASRLPYLSAVIRETLRLHPTAPGFTVHPKSQNAEDYPLFLGKEQYIVRQGESVSVSIPTVHRDPTVYGNDAEEFKPERMVDEEFNKLPKNSYKPFGNGARGCIGRAFALQESTIVIALLLQTFDFELADPDYKLVVRKTLTVKPKGLFIHAKLRDGLTPATPPASTFSLIKSPVQLLSSSSPQAMKANLRTMLSNSSSGFKGLRSPLSQAYIMLYTDAVIGIGVDTFQRIPTLVDDAFIRCGSIALVKRGISDAADGNIANEFDRWADEKLWPALREQYHPGLSAQSLDSVRGGIEIIQGSRTSGLLPGGGTAVVEDENTLTAPGEPQKQHLKVRLPPGMTYRAGDHLIVLPSNHEGTIRQVMNRFGIARDTKMITASGEEHSIYIYLRDFVELNEKASEKVSALRPKNTESMLTAQEHPLDSSIRFWR